MLIQFQLTKNGKVTSLQRSEHYKIQPIYNALDPPKQG